MHGQNTEEMLLEIKASESNYHTNKRVHFCLPFMHSVDTSGGRASHWHCRDRVFESKSWHAQKELHPKSFTQISSQIPKVERKKQSETRNEVPLPEKGTLPVPNCGATKVANVNLTSRLPAKPSSVETPEQSELLKFGSMTTSSMTNLQQTLTKQFEKLQSAMARPWIAQQHDL